MLYLVQSFYQNDYSHLCLPTSAWKTFVGNIISTLVLLQVVLFPLQLVQNATSRLLYRLAPHHNFSRSAFSFIYLFIFNQGVSVVSPKLWKYPSSRALFITGILKTSLFLLCVSSHNTCYQLLLTATKCYCVSFLFSFPYLFSQGLWFWMFEMEVCHQRG